MTLILSKKTLLALLPYFIQASATASGSASGSGSTTRYWDCCKPSCAWSGKATLASGATPVQMCSVDDKPITDDNAVSGCQGGSAYMCSDNSPWAVTDDLAYGYAAVSIAGGSESSWCCACYELTFTSTALAGKKMIVQATNTGNDLSSNQFDLAIPGGGVGIYNGCTTEWGAPSSGWGAQYGGISSASACATFPTALQAGCDWRYDWFQGADNPSVDFVQVECPAALTAKTGCVRAGEVPTGPSSVVPSSSATSTSTSASSSSSTVASATPTSTTASSTASKPSSTTVESTSSSSTQVKEVATPSSSSTVTATPTASPTSIIPVVAPSSSSSSSTKTVVVPNTSSASFTLVPASTMTSVIMHTVTATPSIAPPSEGEYCEL